MSNADKLDDVMNRMDVMEREIVRLNDEVAARKAEVAKLKQARPQW